MRVACAFLAASIACLLPSLAPRPGCAQTVGQSQADREHEIEQLFHRLDRDGDGHLSDDESTQILNGELRNSDLDGDGKVDLAEWRKFVKAHLEREAADPPERAGSLPSNLPAWFEEYDVQRDGQVALYEWRAQRRSLAEFRNFDLNGDGFITVAEMIRSGHFSYAGKTPPRTASGLRGRTGEFYYLEVTGATAGTVWGTDVYTTDSPIATAAVHAGLLRPGRTGVVKVFVLPGQSSYRGSARHGVTTRDFGKYGGSYRLERGPAVARRRHAQPEPEQVRPGQLASNLPAWFQECDTEHDGQVGLYEWRARRRALREFPKYDLNGDGFITIAELIRSGHFADSDKLPPRTVQSLRAKPGEFFYFVVTGATSGTVWGTDVYTTDSPIAAAAVHAGILQAGQKGLVKVTVLPGQSSYQGSARRGVTTRNYGNYVSSFRIERGR